MSVTEYDRDHHGLDVLWTFVPPRSERAEYRGRRLVARHTGQSLDHQDLHATHMMFVDGLHWFNDESFQRLIIRTVDRIDAEGTEL